MIDRERERQDAPRGGLALMHQDALIDTAGADDGDLRRNDDQVGETS